MAPPAASNSAATGGPSRARPQASRRKVNHSADDAAYHGVISSSALAGSKRAAAEKVDGEPRLKRKRLEPTNAGANGVSGSAAGGLGRKSNNTNEVEKESKPSMVSLCLKVRCPRVYGMSAVARATQDLIPTRCGVELVLDLSA